MMVHIVLERGPKVYKIRLPEPEASILIDRLKPDFLINNYESPFNNQNLQDTEDRHISKLLESAQQTSNQQHVTRSGRVIQHVRFQL